ncbi:ubiquitin-associated protein 1-like isoform X2 [Mizuhopecten yessoensis]|uniref:ubiquitin-associated protein 1-like isoform X2 n=1 Tax=Mizuhopecten yessoensis TaxID=6573 RepID=UPI000B45953E|nr:ubiquitin-associated protein 1-like isoform X2 [Mizuhopecten yessoensis]
MTADDDIIEKHGRRLHTLRHRQASIVSTMAYRDYDRENNEVYGSSISYLDGVPFKISSGFKPPTKVQLPSTLMRKTRVAATRHEEYSFEIEEGVLQWAHERERQLEAQKREEGERQQKANQLREQESQRSSSDDSEPDDEWLASHQSSGPALSGVTPKVGRTGQVASSSVPLQPLKAGLTGSDILTPTPIHTDSNNQHSSTASQNVDVSQFEKVDDPFDMFERQTLNDIEELKSLFSTTDTSAKTTETNSYTANNQSEAENIYENVNSNNSNKSNNVCYPPNGSVGSSHERSAEAGEYVQIETKQLECDGQAATSQIDHGSLPPISQSKEFLVGRIPLPPIGSNGLPSMAHERLHSECETGPSSHLKHQKDVPLYENVNNTQLYENVQILQDNRVSFNANKYSRNNLNSPTPVPPRNRPNYVNVMPQGLGTAGTVTGTGDNPAGMRNALSSPDISSINSLGLHDYDNTRNISSMFSRSPPPRPSSQQSWNKYQPLPVTIPSNLETMPGSSKSSSSSDLASPSEIDPYLRLSPEAQRAVDNFVSMGFSKPRSARAVEKFGKDDKEVIEHLCGVNNLSEKGFDTHHAETVLLLYNNDVKKAEKYLDTFHQFKELGFSHDRIKEALVTNNLDREKALDYLTT